MLDLTASNSNPEEEKNRIQVSKGKRGIRIQPKVEAKVEGFSACADCMFLLLFVASCSHPIQIHCCLQEPAAYYKTFQALVNSGLGRDEKMKLLTMFEMRIWRQVSFVMVLKDQKHPKAAPYPTESLPFYEMY
jgi:hypothetical protein